VLSDAEGTLKRRSVERLQDPIGSSLRYTSPADVIMPNTDGTTTVTGPILTLNCVSNPASARRVDRSPASTISRRYTPTTTSGHRGTHSTSSERRYSFDDESQKFDWSATLNLISRLDDDQSTTATTTRQRSQDAVEPSVVSTRVERSTNWEATLPAYPRDRSGSSGGDDWRSRTLPGQRDYSSDSEDSSSWLERQRQRLHQRKSTGSSSPTTSTIKARIVFPPARTELERRLVGELRASQERLNVEKSLNGGPRDGLYSSCTLPRPSSSLSRGQFLTNGFHDRGFTGDTRSVGRYSTLPSRGRPSVGGVQRASSELDFTVESASRNQSMYNCTGVEKHQSLTSLRGGDNVVEQRLVKSTVSRQTGARR